MTNGRKKLIVATVVWGDWHIGAMLDLVLPSLLASGNFPYLSRFCDIEHLIITRPEDAARIEASRPVQAARRFVAVIVIPAIDAELIARAKGNMFVLHHHVWSFAYERAKNTGSYVLNLPPDSIFADGAGKVWAELLQQHKKSIWWVYPRASEAVVPRLKERITLDGALVMSPREMATLNLDPEYLHPISKAFFAEGQQYPSYHPEMALWPVGDEGILLRAFVGEGRLFDPNRVELVQGNMTGVIAPEDFAFVDDSERLYTIALAPATHNAEWYSGKTRQADPFVVGHWWLRFDGTSNDLVAARQIRIHRGTCTEALWRQREMRANLFMSQAVASREFFRVAQIAFQADWTWAAHLVTMLARSRAALRLIQQPGPKIVFIPTDDAAATISTVDLLRPSSFARLAKLVRQHVAVDERPGMTLGQRLAYADGTLRLRSFAGEDLIVQLLGTDRVTVNGLVVSEECRSANGLAIYAIEGVLDSNHAQRARDAA